MSNKKIPELTSLSSPVASDLLYIVDVSDTTDDSSGSSKKTTLQYIADFLASITQTLTNKRLTLPKINEDVALTATATELNVLDGIPAGLTATEIGYSDGVTSSIQTQINTKVPTSYLDTDVTLAANSDSKIATQKATKSYTDNRTTTFGVQVVDAGTDTAVGDAKAFFIVPSQLNGFNLTGVKATVYTAGTTGTTDIQLRNKTDSVDMLSTKMTIDSTETDTATAATPAVIDTTKDDVVTGDVIAIDVDAVSTTKAKGLFILLTFTKP